jgi:hypothetical protein
VALFPSPKKQQLILTVEMASGALASLKSLSLPDLAALKLPRTWSWTTVAIPSFLVYTLLCNYLRMQRRNAMVKKFGYTTRASMAKMSNVDAQEITAYLGQLEFPRLYLASLQFALFKVFILP